LLQGLFVVVRLSVCGPPAIPQPLDRGAAGVQVPQISTPSMAHLMVHSGKYHPAGMRGLQPHVRSASYRACGTPEYLAYSSQETVRSEERRVGKEGEAMTERASERNSRE